jgi:uridine kinase
MRQSTKVKNELQSRSERRLSIDDVCARITSTRRPNRVVPRMVGIDGLGGSGKSTLAARLAEHLGDSAVVQTDYFASWDNPLDWYPRLISEALEPLSRGHAARFQCFDWEKRAPGPWLNVSPAPVILLEGVSATRRALARFLAYRIWADAARDVRLARGLQRDGEAMRGQWEAWMRDEDAYVAKEHPERSADLVTAGDPHVHHDPEREIVVRSWPDR